MAYYDFMQIYEYNETFRNSSLARPCVHHWAHSVSKHTEDYCFVQPVGHDLALSWLFRPLERRDINLLA